MAMENDGCCFVLQPLLRPRWRRDGVDVDRKELVSNNDEDVVSITPESLQESKAIISSKNK